MLLRVAFAAGLLGLASCGDSREADTERRAAAGWSAGGLALLESLSLGALPPPPARPSNRVADLPAAAELGHRLFFDTGLSSDGAVACATCHLPERLFSDGRATSRGIAETSRNAPTLVGAAWSPWMFWDGRRDSLWAQALAPLETPAEMGSTRLAVVRRVVAEPALRAEYARAFGEPPELPDAERLPLGAGPFGRREERSAWDSLSAAQRRAVDAVFANVGKAIAAYERLLRPGPSRFDRYVGRLLEGGDAEGILSEQELHGLRLFADGERTQCLRCHNGPLLTNHAFHQVGTGASRAGVPDFGRFLGLQAVLIDPFNCLGDFSDAQPEQCGELRFVDRSHVGSEMGKFKTPTLRGLARTAPYLHDGRFADLQQVIEHYRQPVAPGAPPLEFTPLDLDDAEARALVAFLAALDGGVDAEQRWLRPPPASPGPPGS